MLLLGLAAACSTTAPLAPPAPPVVSENAFELDPRYGYAGTTPAAIARTFNRAVVALQQGDLATADENFRTASDTSPAFPPAVLGQAIVAFEEERFDDARRLHGEAVVDGSWTAAAILDAELAIREDRAAEALAAYEALSRQPDAPADAARRARLLRQREFDALYARALNEPAAESVATLRAAIDLVDAESARLLLSRRLIELKRYDEAKRALDQILLRGPGDPDQVQELLADIDYGKGRYQDAIRRLEPLAQKNPQRFSERLAEVKRRWSEANMPPRYREAVTSESITRSELATLIYWRVPAVRFAKNLPEPPIAVDLGSASGREEMVRAMALGLFPVDPITRTVSPGRVVTFSNYQRILGRLLRLNGVPSCAAAAGGDTGAELTACGVPVPVGDAISGDDAVKALEAIAAATPD